MLFDIFFPLDAEEPLCDCHSGFSYIVLFFICESNKKWKIIEGDCTGYSVICTDLFLSVLDEKISSGGKEENTQLEEECGLIC